MRACKHADGRTYHPRHIPVVTVGPGGAERRGGGPHEVVDVETTVMTATRGLLESLHPPGWSKFLNDFAEQGEWWKHGNGPLSRLDSPECVWPGWLS